MVKWDTLGNLLFDFPGLENVQHFKYFSKYVHELNKWDTSVYLWTLTALLKVHFESEAFLSVLK